MRRYPPVPDDFAERMHEPRAVLCKDYARGKDTIAHWRQLCGYVSQHGIAEPIPPEFNALADKMSIDQLAARFQRSTSTIEQWRKRLGIRVIAKPFVAPEGFVEFMARHMLEEAEAHYGVKQNTILRYCLRHNIQFVRKPRALPPRTNQGSWGKARAAPVNLPRYGIHDEAVDLLRRYRWTVYRCDERGRQKDNGTLFRVGNVVCDGDELLVRADKYRRAVA